MLKASSQGEATKWIEALASSGASVSQDALPTPPKPEKPQKAPEKQKGKRMGVSAEAGSSQSDTTEYVKRVYPKSEEVRLGWRLAAARRCFLPLPCRYPAAAPRHPHWPRRAHHAAACPPQPTRRSLPAYPPQPTRRSLPAAACPPQPTRQLSVAGPTCRGCGCSPRVAAHGWQARAFIFSVVKDSALFAGVTDEQREDLVNAMQELKVSQGEMVITQGDEGNDYYVVRSGEYSVLLKQAGDTPVHTYHPGGAFGELALLYNKPRAASIKCKEAGSLYALDRATFRAVLMTGTKTELEKKVSLLKRVNVLEVGLLPPPCPLLPAQACQCPRGRIGGRAALARAPTEPRPSPDRAPIEPRPSPTGAPQEP